MRKTCTSIKEKFVELMNELEQDSISGVDVLLRGRYGHERIRVNISKGVIGTCLSSDTARWDRYELRPSEDNTVVTFYGQDSVGFLIYMDDVVGLEEIPEPTVWEIEG